MKRTLTTHLPGAAIQSNVEWENELWTRRLGTSVEIVFHSVYTSNGPPQEHDDVRLPLLKN